MVKPTSLVWLIGNDLPKELMAGIANDSLFDVITSPYSNTEDQTALDSATTTPLELKHVIIVCDSLPADAQYTGHGDWLTAVEEKTSTTFALAQQAIKKLGQVDGEKTLTFVTDIFGIGGVAESKAAAALSGAIQGMAKSLAKEMSRYEISVNTVAVGELPEIGMSSRLNPAQEKLVKMTKLGSTVSLTSLIASIGFIQQAGMSMTGQVLTVDGGLLI